MRRLLLLLVFITASANAETTQLQCLDILEDGELGSHQIYVTLDAANNTIVMHYMAVGYDETYNIYETTEFRYRAKFSKGDGELTLDRRTLILRIVIVPPTSQSYQCKLAPKKKI